MALTENEIIDIIYNLYETDDDGWDTTSSEYITARAICNAAINDWAKRQTWRDLWTTLTSAADGTKTTTAGDWDYTTPTNLVYPASWVRTTNNGNNTFWQVIPPEQVSKYASDYSYFCYFTGSIKAGFTLNFNPRITMATGDTINYEYYKTPTLFTATTSTTEIPDPYYLVYYTLARLLKNDGEDFTYEEQKAREIMDNMTTTNVQGYFDIQNQIDEPLGQGVGFGV